MTLIDESRIEEIAKTAIEMAFAKLDGSALTEEEIAAYVRRVRKERLFRTQSVRGRRSDATVSDNSAGVDEMSSSFFTHIR